MRLLRSYLHSWPTPNALNPQTLIIHFFSHPNVVQCRQVHDFCQVTTLWKKAKLHIPSNINTQMNLILLLFWGQLGCQGSNENFCKSILFVVKKINCLCQNCLYYLGCITLEKRLIFNHSLCMLNGIRTPNEAFFIEIQNFRAWADELGK